MDTDHIDERTQILSLFDRAVALKEVARRSPRNIDSYLTAAPLFSRAAELSLIQANRPETSPNDKQQHLAFGHYYAYEAEHCKGGYYYESHTPDKSIEHLERAQRELKEAITYLKELPVDISDATKRHLASFVPNWQHFLMHLDFQVLANKARECWDSARFVEALDLYRVMADTQRKEIDNDKFQAVRANYRRIAIGNYIATMANISSALAANILERTKHPGEDRVSEIPFDLLVRLVRHTLDAYRFANQAFDQNPEWDQYREIANLCRLNLENLLRDNPSVHLPLSIVFRDDPDFLNIFKLTELTSQPTQVTHPEKTRILFLSANPVDSGPLRLDEELRSIKQKVRSADYPNQFEFFVAGAARPDDFLQELNANKPHIVHFSGHGSDAEELVVCDDSGNHKLINKDALVSLFQSSQDGVVVVVLNACYSKPQAEAIASVVPCAIGMKDSISDDAAVIFAASFYRALAFGFSVHKAFLQGITALKLEGSSETDTPGLFTRADINAAEVFVIQP